MINLPKIIAMRVQGFSPLFDHDLDIPFPTGCYLIMGGNGLGKTTLLQSLVYCIAGSFDEDIEEIKSFRWGVEYFRKRIANPNSAIIEVDLVIGQQSISIRRGLRSPVLLGFRFGNQDWIENPDLCQEAYRDAITELGGFKAINDFRYLVHKLIYLPEKRPNLAWDRDAQVRIFMMLCSDIIDEESFRKKRKLLKETDSKQRHTMVAINKAKKHIETLLEYDEEESSDEDDFEIELVEEDEETKSIPHLDVGNLVEEIRFAGHNRRILQNEMVELRRIVSEVTTEIENLHEKVESSEESLIFNSLRKIESQETQLAIYKLISMGLCPACGKKSKFLQDKAKTFISQKCCPLCGHQDQFTPSEDMSKINEQLSEKLKYKLNTENRIIQLQELISDSEKKEQSLQMQYDEYRLTQPVQKLIEYDIPVFTKEQLKIQLEKLEREHSDLGQRVNQLENELEKTFNHFLTNTTNRFEKLNQLYKSYSTEFLGIDCDLIPVEIKDRLLTLTLFVPKFADKIRETENECSEAQRFFLDIAFRMAIIHLAGELSDGIGSFICETPENALDMSYVDNVATMFNKFAQHDQTVILTSNIQPGSVAKPILAPLKPEDRKAHVLNLLSLGSLTKVQLDNKPKLEKVINDILEGDIDGTK